MNDDERKASDYLKAFVPRPAPPELRQKALAAAQGIQPAGRFLTSGQWGMAAICVFLIVGSLAGDSILSGRQARRLDALLDGRPAAVLLRDADRLALEELVGAQEARTMGRLLTRPGLVRASAKDGWPDRNILAFEEKEDADVHSKNPR
jgi:hypothetical protein